MHLFISFVIALALTAALIPILMRLAPRMGLNDAPGPRKVHAVAVPRVGGIAMAFGVLVPAMLLPEHTHTLYGLLAGIVVLLLFGVWDDRSTLGYRTKFVGQALAIALAMTVGDIRIDSLTIESRAALPEPISWALTFSFLLGVTNAVNLADGLDGLAGGLALLCTCAIAMLAATSGHTLVLALALIQAGSIMGFLRFNTHPARVFMGDCGSQMLGFNVGALAILVTQGEETAFSAALPLLLIGVPIMDTLAVMAHRIRLGRSPFLSDRNHIHHRLLTLGFTHGDAVILIYGVQCTLFLLAYFLRFESDLIIVAVFAAVSVTLLGAVHWSLRVKWQARRDGAVRGPASLLQGLRRLVPLTRIQTWATWASLLSLGVYAGSVIVGSEAVSADLATLCLVLLAPLLIVSVARVHALQGHLVRIAAYVSVVLIVYLDQISNSKPPALHALSSAMLWVIGASALVRFWASSDRRFQMTSLDVLVIFVAIVVPNLLGTTWLSQGFTDGVAKVVAMLYVVEMLLGVSLDRPLPRAIVGVLLAVIALRGFLPLAL